MECLDSGVRRVELTKYQQVGKKEGMVVMRNIKKKKKKKEEKKRKNTYDNTGEKGFV